MPFVRKANFTVKWRRGIVGEMTEFLNKNGVTVTDLDQYRAGPDVVLEGFAHLPTGLAEFPQVKVRKTGNGGMGDSSHSFVV